MFAAQMSQMNMSADAWCAPACQAAQMPATTASSRTLILDAALWAVSFLFIALLGKVSGLVRIIGLRVANP